MGRLYIYSGETQMFFKCSAVFAKMIQFDSYVSSGLVQPPAWYLPTFCHKKYPPSMEVTMDPIVMVSDLTLKVTECGCEPGPAQQIPDESKKCGPKFWWKNTTPPKFNILLMVQKSCEHQLRLVVYPIIYRVLCHIPGGCLGFLPSTACPWKMMGMEDDPFLFGWYICWGELLNFQGGNPPGNYSDISHRTKKEHHRLQKCHPEKVCYLGWYNVG